MSPRVVPAFAARPSSELEEYRPLLTIPEVAALLSVSPITVRRRIARGELEAVRVGTADVIRIEPEAVAACLQPIIEYPARAPRTGREPAVEARAPAGRNERGERP